jgi:lipoyl(octanoyl) transferase
MRRITNLRDDASGDELWLLEHPRVFTLGQAGRSEHVLAPGDIPVIASDRGGQVTYHGPGQLVAYLLMDLRRRRLGVRQLVDGLEQCIIDMLAGAGVAAGRRERAPGVYVAGRKICALGLRIRNGCSYHGLALNVDMDLEPFARIDPCGYPGLEVTQLTDEGIPWDLDEAGRRLVTGLARQFAYRAHPEVVTTG